MKIKRFFLLGTLMLCFAAFFGACDCSFGNEKIDPALRLELKDGVYHVVGIRDSFSITEIELPLTYNGVPVSVYEENVFNHCTELSEIRFKGSLADWCALTFKNRFSNPMHTGAEFFYGENEHLGASLVIPDGTKKIGNHAFISRSSLTEAAVPRSVEEIGFEAFAYNENLISVSLTSAAARMDENFISECPRLLTINFDGTLADWCRTGHIPVGNSVYLYVGGDLVSGDVVIPEGVEKISSYAFNFCEDITSVTFPSTLRVIERNAFRKNNSLTTVTLPAGLETVETGAFSECGSLESAYIPASVKEMGEMIFTQFDKKIITVYCETVNKPLDWSEESVKWDNGCKDVIWGYNNIRTNGSFDYARHGDDVYITKFKGSGDVIIPEQIDGGTVVSFGMTFYDSPQITSVNIPASVTDIFPYAFYGCGYLESADIADGVEKIGKFAFSQCEKLSSLKFGTSVAEIGDEAFYNCHSLEKVNYGGEIADWCKINFATINSQPVAASAYYDDSNLPITSGIYMNGVKIEEDLTIPQSVTQIPDYAFAWFSSITSLTVPESVERIGDEAFYSCLALIFADLRGGSTIGRQAFRYSSLERLNLSGVTEINYAAFQNCTRLKTIEFSPRLKIIKDSAFKSIPIEELILPESVEKIEKGAFGYNHNLKTVMIPASAEVDSSAFYNVKGATFYCPSPEKPQKWFFIEKDTDVIYNVRSFGTEKDHSYITFNDGTARLTEYLGETDLTELAVPDKIDGCYVTDIGSVYRYCTADKFIVNDHVTILKAYSVPSEATETIVGKSVEIIENDAFEDCYKIQRLYLPLNVKTIESLPDDFIDLPAVVYAEAPSKPEGWNFEERYLYFCWNVKEVHKNDKYEYAVLNDGAIELVKVAGEDETVIIPDYIDGKPVTALGNIFYERSAKHLVLGENVKKINRFIFSWEALDDLETAEFKNPRGWQVSESADFAEPTDVPESILKNPELAASLFKKNYYFLYWRRI